MRFPKSLQNIPNTEGYKNLLELHRDFGCDLISPANYNLSEKQAAKIRMDFYKQSETNH